MSLQLRIVKDRKAAVTLCMSMRTHVNIRHFHRRINKCTSAICSQSPPDRCNMWKYYINGIQHHQLRHQKSDNELDKAVAQYGSMLFLLSDIEFKNISIGRDAEDVFELATSWRKGIGSYENMNDWCRNYASGDFQSNQRLQLLRHRMLMHGATRHCTAYSGMIPTCCGKNATQIKLFWFVCSAKLVNVQWRV